MLKRFPVLLLLFTAGLMLTACPSKKAEAPKGRPPATVMVALSSQMDVPVQLKAIGTMEASESITVKTQISGELTQVAFREGADVEKGALLFRIDSRPYLAALKKAEAAVARDRVVMENAKRNYERYRQLVKEGIVTEEQAEAYRTTAESAAATMAAGQAEVDNARAQLSYCTITAPVSGRLGQLAVDKGNVVKANETALVTINKLSPIHASFTVPEKELPEIKRQMAAGRLEVNATVPDAAEISEKGTITFIDNTVDSTTGTIRLKGTFENKQKHLWPGQFVNLSVILSVTKNAVVVPSQAVQIGQKGQFVFVVKPDTSAEMRPVVTGHISNGITVIETGLQPGEQVVVDGQMRVVPGGKVDIKQPEKPGIANGVAPPAGSGGTAGAAEKGMATGK